MNDFPAESLAKGGKGDGVRRGDTLLAEPENPRAATQSDLNLIRRAMRERWAVPADVQQLAVERLKMIIQKPTVTTMTQEGPASLDGPADANAVRAASVLVAMSAQNQADDHLADKNSRLDAGKPTELTGLVIRTPMTEASEHGPRDNDG